ncbi:efflux RND transporter periplasmic adaptor subunit [Planctomicrobium sp. SH527]|uniref:efflux RND transporter periplasmic adaptor subunit n=1 Tax=Planctomicrobium sp. SH527 TaxID=3448123 RepID=UPI003F5C3803
MRNPLLLVAGLGLVLIAGGCQPRNQLVQTPPPKVTVAVPVEKPVQDYFYTTGQTRAVASVQLRARVSGYLDEIRFKDGDMVKKDQVLFVIDQAPYQAALDSAVASLAKAKAQLNLAEKQLQRTSALAKENAATESNLDIQQSHREAAVADVAAAEAAMRQAQLNLDYTEIKAPFDGRIGRHMVDLGNLVAIGETLLASLEAVDPIYVYFTLSEQELLTFMEGTKTGSIPVIDETDPPLFELAIGSSDNFLFQGKLDFREFGINPQTGTTDRRAVFQNSDVTLVPGLFCRLRAPVGPPKERLLVDERAVSTDQRGKFLLVVNAENKVELKIVKVGPLHQGLRVIESGIAKTDRVVINGLQRARPESVVDPTEVPMEARINGAAVGGKPAGADHPAKAKAAEKTPADAKNETAESSKPASKEEPAAM